MAESDVVDSSSSSKKKSKKWIQKYKPEYSQAFNFVVMVQKTDYGVAKVIISPYFWSLNFLPFPPFFLRPGLPYCHCPKLASLQVFHGFEVSCT